ncbi:hypothetical protein BDW74DRAFT_177241 [Aspergillus multicolor]|uniref:uncharacterized protein n=1 Tax=Aspergillus multicolor TaxID=41759 RepID=UPI003CCD1BE7
MHTEAEAEAEANPKPFPCRHSGCTARYHRPAHRRRHEAQHDPAKDVKCAICDKGFGRRRGIRCSLALPLSAFDGDGDGPGLAPKAEIEAEVEPDAGEHQTSPKPGSTESLLASHLRSHAHDRDHPTAPSSQRSNTTREQHFLTLYFAHFHPHWSFVHQGSFRAPYEARLLVQSMVVIGLWHSGEENAKEKAMALHDVLGTAIQRQKVRSISLSEHHTEGQWDASSSPDASSNCSWPLPTYQAILLHIIFGVLCAGSRSDGTVLDTTLKPRLSPAQSDLLHRLVQSVRALEMLSYPNMLARFSESDLPAYVWVSIEELKRFNVALYKVCRLCGGGVGEDLQGQQTETAAETGTGSRSLTDSRNKTVSEGLHARELQFPPPRNNALWMALRKAEWEAAVTEDVHRHDRRLEDTLECEWISNSADLLELVGT